MKTVKELSDLTGISVRALHYYDEIGLLKPTAKSEAGYRLYDDGAIERLQQILFFREFDIPLKEIKAIMENSALETNQILQMQRNMLTAKKERIERLIANIDSILKGGQRMDFKVFSKTELEEMYCSMVENMTEEQKAAFLAQYGDLKEWKKKFLENASTETARQNLQKVVEWYGSKEKALDACQKPGSAENVGEYQKQLDKIVQKLAEKKGQSKDSPEVSALMAEYDSVAKKLFQLPDVSKMILDMAAAFCSNPEIQAAQDKIYGEGASDFIGRAMQAFYKKEI